MLVQDYHLCLVAGAAGRRCAPTCACVHFSHTPFAPPVWLEALPDGRGAELLDGDGRPPRLRVPHRSGGPTTSRPRPATWPGLTPPTFVSPLASDPDDIRGRGRRARAAATRWPTSTRWSATGP